MVKFNKNYFSVAILIFLIEVVIALYVHDKLVRPYVGDVLVVIMMYCFVRAFFNMSSTTLAFLVLVFAFTIEGLQYLHIVRILGLQDSPIARTVIGTSFAWHDLLAYVLGISIVIAAEKYLKKQTPPGNHPPMHIASKTKF
jgi:hypothetical protein